MIHMGSLQISRPHSDWASSKDEPCQTRFLGLRVLHFETSPSALSDMDIYVWNDPSQWSSVIGFIIYSWESLNQAGFHRAWQIFLPCVSRCPPLSPPSSVKLAKQLLFNFHRCGQDGSWILEVEPTQKYIETIIQNFRNYVDLSLKAIWVEWNRNLESEILKHKTSIIVKLSFTSKQTPN